MSVSQVVLSLPGVSVSDSVPAHLFLSLLQSLPLSRVASTWFFLSFLRAALFSSTFPPSPSISTSVFISVSFIVLTCFYCLLISSLLGARVNFLKCKSHATPLFFTRHTVQRF